MSSSRLQQCGHPVRRLGRPEQLEEPRDVEVVQWWELDSVETVPATKALDQLQQAR